MDVSAEHKLLQDSVSRLLKDRCASQPLRAIIASGKPAENLWKEMGGLGVHGLLLPESVGGMGMPAEAALVVAAEMGRRLAPVPYIQNWAAGRFVVQTGGSRALGEILKKCVEGSAAITLGLDAEGLEWDLDGARAVIVPHAAAISHIVVSGTRRGGKTKLHAVPLSEKGVSVKKTESLDLTHPLFEVRISKQALTAGPTWESNVSKVASALAGASRLAAACLSAEMLGAAEELMNGLIDYAKARVQFDRPIGTFQAVQHKAADAGILLEGIRSYVWSLVSSGVDGGKGSDARIGMAKAYCSDAYTSIAEIALQVFAGIGYTWEHDSHLYLRHARRCGAEFGSAAVHRARCLLRVG